MSQSINGRLVLQKAGLPAQNRIPTKYRAIKTTIDGIRFDSKKEGERYLLLKHLLKAGEIKDLQLQMKFPIEINGFRICEYRADFCYIDTATNQFIVEDVKGFKTDIYALKKKLVRAVYGITIKEV